MRWNLSLSTSSIEYLLQELVSLPEKPGNTETMRKRYTFIRWQDPARGYGGGWQHLFGGDVRRDQVRPRAPESGQAEPWPNWVPELLDHVPLMDFIDGCHYCHFCWISLTKLRVWDCDCRALNLKHGVPSWAPGSVWLFMQVPCPGASPRDYLTRLQGNSIRELFLLSFSRRRNQGLM